MNNSNKKNKLITYKTIYDRMRKKAALNDYLDDLKLITNLTGVFFGNPLGGQVEQVISALAEKTIIIDAGKRLLDKVKVLEEPSYKDRIEKMKISYALIYYTAFFDAMDDSMPDIIRDRIKLISSEKKQLYNDSSILGDKSHNDEYGIVFPSMFLGLSEIDEYLSNLYNALTNGVFNFVKYLAFSDDANEEEEAAFRTFIKELPEHALNTFHNQFFALCSDFNEFYIYTSVEHYKTIEDKLDNNNRILLDMAMRIENPGESSSIGLADLEGVITKLSEKRNKDAMIDIADSIRKHYQKNISRPLMESDTDGEELTFPPIEKSFIPQAYKLLKYSKKMSLSSINTWAKADVCQDMSSFWAKYLVDIDSTESILLILGEPGGGKSLLTKIVSARLSSEAKVVVRIPLREHDVDNGIESIICTQLMDDGDASEDITKFKKFAEQFPMDPITLIFDGFDEVQQATGRVYRQFLVNLHKFQLECKENERPVRIVVTSRESLIDMAIIPSGTTVMKLLEFDEDRINAFIKIWNEYNHDILCSKNLNDFALPKGNHNIELLSSQPLLLTMLAIYDADFENSKNALALGEEQEEQLDRTSLYDELLRRFIRRELRKGKRESDDSRYDDLDSFDQEKMVDTEMKKLGVAALGMFVREKLSITIDELEADFKNTEIGNRSSNNGDSASIRDGAALLGSFFFICDPRSKKNTESAKTPLEDEQNPSFEFLHKTFYEFLITDLVLESLMDTVSYLNITKKIQIRPDLYRNALANHDDFNSIFFPSLGGACLCTEPEIIKMISEWKDNKIKKYIDRDNPEEGNRIVSVILCDLFNKHVSYIRDGLYKELVVIKSRSLLPERPYPQSCAVYLLNLLTVRILLENTCYIDATEWSYISQYIKLNLPSSKKNEKEENAPHRYRFKIVPTEEVLLSFMSFFDVYASEDNNQQVIFSKRVQTLDFEQKNLVNARMEVFDFLQDDISKKLYALHDIDVDAVTKSVYRTDLNHKGMGLQNEEEEALLKSTYNRLLFAIYNSDTELINDFTAFFDRVCVFVSRDFRYHKGQFYVNALIYLNNLLSAWSSELEARSSNLERIIMIWYDFIKCLSHNDLPYLREGNGLLYIFDITKALLRIAIKCVAFPGDKHYLPQRLHHESVRILSEFILKIMYLDTKTALELTNILIETGFYNSRITVNSYIVMSHTYHHDRRAFTSSAQIALISIKLLSNIDNFFREQPDFEEEMISHKRMFMEQNIFLFTDFVPIQIILKYILDDTSRKLSLFMQTEISCLPTLLREVLRIGKFKWVRSCLVRIYNTLLENSSLSIFSMSVCQELNAIATIVGVSYDFANKLLDVCHAEHISGEGTVFHDMYMLINKPAIIEEQMGVVQRFLNRFQSAFAYDTVSAVDLLALIIDTDYSKTTQCDKAVLYSLLNFGYYSKSLRTATNILFAINKKYLCGRQSLPLNGRGGDSYHMFMVDVELLINSCLADGNRADANYLIELVDELDAGVFLSLNSYFKMNLSYIGYYNLELADKIKQKLEKVKGLI